MPVAYNFEPVHLKILAMLEKTGEFPTRRIAEIIDITRYTAEAKLEYLEDKGLARIHSTKLFDKGREANLWELTEEGKSFVNAARSKGELPRIRLSEMNENVLGLCKEILNILEKPSSFDELARGLEASGNKIRDHKLSDVLRLLEIFGMIREVQGPKEVKARGLLGAPAISPEPGGIIVFVKSEGADLNSAEL